MINFSTASKNLIHTSQSSQSVVSEHPVTSQEQSNTELLGFAQNNTNGFAEEFKHSTNNGAVQTHSEDDDILDTYYTLSMSLYANQEANHIL